MNCSPFFPENIAWYWAKCIPAQCSTKQRANTEQRDAAVCGAEQYTHSLASKQDPLAPGTGLRVEGAQPTLKPAVEERLPLG